MTQLIESVQLLEPGSELVELFEIELDSSTIYFCNTVDSDLTNIQFRERTSPYTVRTYTPIPIEMSNISFNVDGASDRPVLTIGNVLNTFSSAIGMLNEDLIGKKVTKRSTLKKYLYTEIGDSTPPVEFPIHRYYIDRVASENNLSVSFDLVSPFDVTGVKLPNRTVLGKYCSWIYQGNDLNLPGGCTWNKNSIITYSNSSGTTNDHKAYFSKQDKPIVPESSSSAMISAGWSSSDFETYTVYSGAQVSQGNFVEYTLSGQTTIWKAIKNVPENTPPSPNSVYWNRGDICGKTLNSCKCRFQFIPQNTDSNNSIPSVAKKVREPLPFGAFIGTDKFR